ncbi:uncharacterized protein LOC132752560 [Ruditapes philippinarum]|uniref:uncharacterized protein LOC132752560 n=1 Tax=Ruditapes philippinarum TaxID=129788 RepID=UPI00295BE57A|nr:uncharacterized protein LOC132752560 [Ruditapes philippinarum]
MGCSSCLRFSNVSGVTAACFVVIFVLYSVQRLKPDIRILEMTSPWKRKNTILTHSDGSENHVKYEENLAGDSVQMAKFNTRKQEQRFKVQQHSNLTEEKNIKSNAVKGKVTIKRDKKIKKAQKATQTQRLQHFRKTCKKYKFNGYIRKTARFPKEEYIKQEDYASPEYLIQVVMKEVTTNPLKHDEKAVSACIGLYQALSAIGTCSRC